MANEISDAVIAAEKELPSDLTWKDAFKSHHRCHARAVGNQRQGWGERFLDLNRPPSFSR